MALFTTALSYKHEAKFSTFPSTLRKSVQVCHADQSRFSTPSSHNLSISTILRISHSFSYPKSHLLARLFRGSPMAVALAVGDTGANAGTVGGSKVADFAAGAVLIDSLVLDHEKKQIGVMSYIPCVASRSYADEGGESHDDGCRELHLRDLVWLAWYRR